MQRKTLILMNHPMWMIRASWQPRTSLGEVKDESLLDSLLGLGQVTVSLI